MIFFNFYSICLTTAVKTAVKLLLVTWLPQLITIMTYDWISGPYYGYKTRITCRIGVVGLEEVVMKTYLNCIFSGNNASFGTNEI